MPCARGNFTMEYYWKNLFLQVSAMKAPVNAVRDYIAEGLPGAPTINGTSHREYVSKRKYTCQLLAERKCTTLALKRKHSWLVLCKRVTAAKVFWTWSRCWIMRLSFWELTAATKTSNSQYSVAALYLYVQVMHMNSWSASLETLITNETAGYAYDLVFLKK